MAQSSWQLYMISRFLLLQSSIYYSPTAFKYWQLKRRLTLVCISTWFCIWGLEGGDVNLRWHPSGCCGLCHRAGGMSSSTTSATPGRAARGNLQISRGKKQFGTTPVGFLQLQTKHKWRFDSDFPISVPIGWMKWVTGFLLSHEGRPAQHLHCSICPVSKAQELPRGWRGGAKVWMDGLRDFTQLPGSAGPAPCWWLSNSCKHRWVVK